MLKTAHMGYAVYISYACILKEKQFNVIVLLFVQGDGQPEGVLWNQNGLCETATEIIGWRTPSLCKFGCKLQAMTIWSLYPLVIRLLGVLLSPVDLFNK